MSHTGLYAVVQLLTFSKVLPFYEHAIMHSGLQNWCKLCVNQMFFPAVVFYDLDVSEMHLL